MNVWLNLSGNVYSLVIESRKAALGEPSYTYLIVKEDPVKDNNIILCLWISTHFRSIKNIRNRFNIVKNATVH